MFLSSLDGLILYAFPYQVLLLKKLMWQYLDKERFLNVLSAKMISK